MTHDEVIECMARGAEPEIWLDEAPPWFVSVCPAGSSNHDILWRQNIKHKRRDSLTRAESALSALEARGMVVVPKKLSFEMIEEFLMSGIDDPGLPAEVAHELVQEGYRAMLAAKE